jgi:hypothetical protein
MMGAESKDPCISSKQMHRSFDSLSSRFAGLELAQDDKSQTASRFFAAA